MTAQEPEYVETSALIASDMVEGTTVYNRDHEKIGTIRNFMVNKRTGQVEYAVMSFGGFLGMGEDHFPIPWKHLNYVIGQHGYVVDITQAQLDKAPKHGAGEEPVYDSTYAMMVDGYYGMGR